MPSRPASFAAWRSGVTSRPQPFSAARLPPRSRPDSAPTPASSTSRNSTSSLRRRPRSPPNRSPRLLASAPMDDGPRFPKVGEKAGHYESFYVKACRPGGGEGIWIRHTVHKRPGEEPKGSIWFTHFDRQADGPRATKMTVPAAGLSAPDAGWIRVGGAEIGPGRAQGAVATEALKASWDLRFSGDEEPCKYLPADWLYQTPVPKTKFVAPCPSALFDGRLEVN